MPRKRRPNSQRHGGKYPDRDTKLAAFVRQRRKAERLTQRALAELAGVAPRVVWELEHGKPTMRMDVVNSVLAVFGKVLGIDDAPRAEVDE